MRSKLWLNISSIAILLALLLTMPLLSACGEKESTTTTPSSTPTSSATPSTTAPVAVKSESDVVKAAVADYLTHMAPNIKAADLQMKIAEGDAPYIVSVRSAEDYAKGHIPGAVNMKFSDLATLPKDKDIVVYCYTGQSASFAAATLGIQGYNVSNLRDGMSSWSNDPDVYVRRFDPATQGNYAVETTSNEGGSYALPVLDNTASDDAAEIVKAAAATVAPKYIAAKDLNMKIAEGEDMTIVSVRKDDAYAAGHIPGAINIQLSSLVDNLTKINPDTPVYVYCYTGHSAAQATALLQMLGYDAYSLSFGMCGWSSDPAINMGVCFDPSTVQGYATEK
jgi:rhodanese-related sulfurtransferase